MRSVRLTTVVFQACSSEVMMFRMARRYDVNTDSILFVNNQPYSRDSYSLAGMGETIEDLLHFCRTMYSMRVDNAEYALLTAIVIFSGECLYLFLCSLILETGLNSIGCFSRRADE